MPPFRRWRQIAPSPADAMHPQFVQSGLPPNWHGAILGSKSEEKHSVVCAKMHSSGVWGGLAYTLRMPSSIGNLEYLIRMRDRSAITFSRSALVRRSVESSPVCGV